MEEGNKLITKPVEFIPETSGNRTGSIVFLHGSGDTGAGAKEWVESLCKFSFPHLRVLFPTAPLRPYTPSGGWPSNVWFDRLKISPDAPEHMETVDATAKELVNIINQEVASGIPLQRIAVGGFSMGGGMALHMGYRYLRGIAGVFALSSFLASSSVVFKVLQERDSEEKIPPLFMTHGLNDDLVLESWGKDTFNKIRTLGVIGEYYSLPNMAHELNKAEIVMLSNWLARKIPENV